MDVLFARVFAPRKGHAVSKSGIRNFFLAGLLLAFSTSFTASAAIPMAQLSTKQRLRAEAMLTQHIQQLVDRQGRIEGQGKFVKAQVRLDQSRGFVIIDLSQSYLPAERQDLNDLTDEFADEVVFLLKDSITVHGVLFTYDGKDVYDYFPEEKPETQPERVPPKRTSKQDASLLGSRDDFVVISAGHGRYINFGKLGNTPVWDWQRPTESNGIIEDVNNPHFADELGRWFYQRSFDDVVTSPARSTSTAIHAPSGEEWWKVAGKYHLQSILPDNPEVWDFGGHTNRRLADYNKDINSRPKYANYLDATAIIHLHSDASTNPSARGTNAIYHTGREQARLLGNNILCSMKEIIQAQEAYATFPVSTDSLARTNYGENELALMPSVLIEIGFHTNPDDAAALLDPVFRTASMKGVEKGYRLYREGMPCEPFAITNMPPARGNHSTQVPVPTHYEGFPQFPVTAKVEITSCPGTCRDGEQTFSEETPSPLTWTFGCNSSPGSPTRTFGVRTTLIDADGVKTSPVDSTVTCMRASGTSNSSNHAPSTFASMSVI